MTNYEHPFRPGQRVRCVVGDDYFGRYAEPGDEMIVLRAARRSDIFAALWDGKEFIGYNNRFEVVRETSPTAEVDLPRYQQDRPAPEPCPCGDCAAKVDPVNLAEPIPTGDSVFRPNHYARYAIEPITFIQANGLPFDIGNVVKYALRYDAKNGIEDLQKARRYLDIRIETLAREARVASGEHPADVWNRAL